MEVLYTILNWIKQVITTVYNIKFIDNITVGTIFTTIVTISFLMYFYDKLIKNRK
jgi:hypothetical protein